MALTKATLIDLNSNELILDLDADTSITADTDDTIHFKIAGADEIVMTGTALTPAVADGSALGSTSLEWSDVFLADGAVINFGSDQDVTLTHVADSGLALKSVATADDKPVTLVLQTGETDIAANDVLGVLNFQAPDENTGTDAILVAAGIAAVSEGDFSSSANATKLSFRTAVSAAASETMSLTSNGDLFLAGGLIDLKNDGNAVSQIKFYCESSNAHAQTLIGAPHSEGANNVLTLPGTGGDARLVSTASTATLTNKTLTTPVIAEIDSGANITLDATADIILDAGGADVIIKDDGTTIATFTNSSTDFIIESATSDKDIIFKVNDGGSSTEVMRLDGDVSALLMASGKEIQFADSGEKISGNGTDLTLNSGADINLTATTDINVPSGVGVTFGDDGEKIEGDGTDLTIASSAKINLTATSDVHIPNNVGIVFGGDSEKIEGDGTDMTISANNLTVDAAADITLDAAGNDLNFAAGGTTVLTVSNSSSDVVIKPVVDTKDIIFQQRDGTEVARVEDNATFNIPASKLAIGGTAVTATAAELNLLDGGTSVGSSITLADADGFVVNDGGTMKTIPATDLKTYNPGGVYTRVGGSASASDSSIITLDNIMTNDYYQYLITGMMETTTDAYMEFKLRVGGGSGANAGGNYQQSWNGWGSSNSDSYLHNSGDLSTSSILPMSNAAETKNDGDDDHGVFFSMILYTRYLNKTYWRCNAQFLNNDKSRIYGYENVGWQVNTGAITGMSFLFNTGDIDNHRIDIYGLTSG